jgi:hypothetical protein
MLIRLLADFNGALLVGPVWAGANTVTDHEDFYMATSEDTQLAIREDSYMATDTASSWSG